MKIVAIIEDNPITGVRYGTVEIHEYNNNIQRRMDRYYRLRNDLHRKSINTLRTRKK